MILQLDPVGSFERKRSDIAEIEALAKLTREMEVQLDIYIRSAFERLVDLAGSREFLQPFCALQQYLFAIKRKREEQLTQPYNLNEPEWQPNATPVLPSMPVVVDPLFILDLLRMSYQQKPGQKSPTPAPVAPTSPLLRAASFAASQDSSLDAGQQVFVKFMKRNSEEPESMEQNVEQVPDASAATVPMDTLEEQLPPSFSALERAYANSQMEAAARMTRESAPFVPELPAREPVVHLSTFPSVTDQPSPMFFAPVMGMQMVTDNFPSPAKIVTTLDSNPQQLPSPVSPGSSVEMLAAQSRMHMAELPAPLFPGAFVPQIGELK